MHDIGKLGIADAILLKPAKLDAAEWAVMQTHSSIGHNILSKSTAPILQMAATIALHHHERWDGSGYPHGLAGDTIPEVARIVAIADVFDALTMARPYKEPWPLDRVLKTMNDSAGSHFDASMIGNFMEIMQDILAIGEHWASHEFDCKRRF